MTFVNSCLNGGRTRAEHDAVPLTPEELALDAKAVAALGVTVLHVHPRDGDGRESLHPEDVVAAVTAVRAAAPEVAVGVSTRLEACPDRGARLRLVESWPGPAEGGPDFASVNWHEPGAADVAAALNFADIAVEAGLLTTEAARAFASVPRDGILRVLVEAVPSLADAPDGVSAARGILGELAASPTADVLRGIPVVVHGEDDWAWPVLHWARGEGYGLRIGLEDTLTRPDGHLARDNADLVRIVLGHGDAPEGHHVTLGDGLELFYETHGHGPPLVLLHDRHETIESSWGQLLPPLSRSHRVVAVEPQGHGRTGDRDGGVDPRLLAADVRELLGHLGLHRVDVLGAGFGGLAALALAVEHPGVVDRLVLVSAPWPAGGEVLSRDRLGSVAAQTLVVVGDADQVPVSTALELADALPRASLAVLPGTGPGEVTHRADLLVPMLAALLRGK